MEKKKKKNEIFLRRERNTPEVLGKVKYLFLFGGKLVKVGANLLYLWGRTGCDGGELEMGRNLHNSKRLFMDLDQWKGTIGQPGIHWN